MASNLPPELAGNICSFLPSPRDLLALATCTRFRDIVISDHLYFRHLRCDLKSLSFWSTLASMPSIASRFRSLEVVPETDPRRRQPMLPPSSFIPENPDVFSGDDSMISALRHMSGLTFFRWTVPVRPSNKLLATLTACCPELLRVEVSSLDGVVAQGDPHPSMLPQCPPSPTF
jgi:hypothetical protein